MITKRDIALAIILSIVTCGIYGLYWFVVMVDDVNKLSQKEGQFSGVVVLLLSLVTCGIFALYYYYKMGDTLDLYFQRTKGNAPASKGILFLALCVIGLSIVSMALIQNDLNTIADELANGGGYGGTYSAPVEVAILAASETTNTQATDTQTTDNTDSGNSGSGVNLGK